MISKYHINKINKLSFCFEIGDIIFLNWDLWSWKTTISKYILNDILKVKENITSPTYTYYNKYKWILKWKTIDIFHFDLYRIKDYDEFFAIWAEDILDNNSWIILIEWPDLIKNYYKASMIINLFKTQDEFTRKIQVIKN